VLCDLLILLRQARFFLVAVSSRLSGHRCADSLCARTDLAVGRRGFGFALIAIGLSGACIDSHFWRRYC